MKVAILSNLVVDKIVSRDMKSSQSLGGPAAYCGITASKFGFDTTLFTHFGKDLDTKYLEYLKKQGISFNVTNSLDLPTTRFILRNFENDRELILESKCSALDIEEIKSAKSDCWIISPVFDEVSLDILQYLASSREKNQFIILDPQGYTRSVDSAGRISIRSNIDIPINNVNGIKLNSKEITCFTNGLQGIDGMKKIHTKYKIDYVLYTEDQNIHLLERDRRYWLKLPKIDTPDSTGLGDIIASSFACTIVKEKDSVWAFCFAAGALTAALQTKEVGIKKIPSRTAIEENASYYYNIMNYEIL
ncbi:MAG: PfkB family carbohydrate kinase [Nitrososphaeraceae archaeon]